MAQITLKESELVAFENAAAGHEGVLSDPSGSVIIKPCTTSEVEFYELTKATHPAVAAYMPTFMGTLTLSASASATSHKADDDVNNTQDTTTTTTTVVSDIVLDAKSSQQTDLTIDHHGGGDSSASQTMIVGGGGGAGAGAQGKKLDTDLAIVLENVASGFVRPNILDVKLGSQLWDESASASKRARLDQVAAETTSSSLGFRVAGMKVWQGMSMVGKAGNDDVDNDGYRVYGKMYGRQFTAENVIDAFKSFLFMETAGVDEELGRLMAKRLAVDVKGLKEALEKEESRMYSASILFVYEGDGEALRKALEEEKGRTLSRRVGEGALANDDPQEQLDEDEDEDDDEEEEEEEERLKVHAVKLIDFAHASWTPGQGPDENMLKGVRNVEKILQDLGGAT